MSDWNTAFEWMMSFEDPDHACEQVSDAAPAGVEGPCYAISGINSGAWPEDFAEIAAKDQGSRGPFVKQFYQDRFWNNWYEQLASDDVAKRVFDFAVNAGAVPAVRVLQRAVNALGPDVLLSADGMWGPNTVNAANSADAAALTGAFKQQRSDYYQSIVAKNPASLPYLAAWIARANK